MKKLLFFAIFIAYIQLSAIAIDAPVLVSPQNGSTTEDISVNIDWNSVSGNEGYYYQIDTSANFDSPLLQEESLSSSYSNATIEGLFFGKTYYWRVKSEHSGGDSDWSTVWHFTTVNTAFLESPINGLDNLSSTVDLDWASCLGNTGYLVQVDLNSEFTSPSLINETTSINVSTINIQDLLFGNTYYWRVAVKNEVDTSAWSSPWSFTTAFDMENSPQLVSPLNESTELSYESLNLEWQSLDQAANYEIMYAQTIDFETNPTVLTTDLLSETLSDLSPGTQYFWKVRGVNSSGASPWSDIWSFTTAFPPLDAPSLLSPTDNANGLTTSLELIWQDVDGAIDFEYQYSNDITFETILDSDVLMNTTVEISDLAYETEYFWRVRAMNTNQTSEWSEVWSFTTEGDVSSALSLLSTKLEVFPNPAINELFIQTDLDIQYYKIIDTNGNAISNKMDFSKRIRIDNLKSGQYALILFSKTEMITRFFVKQ